MTAKIDYFPTSLHDRVRLVAAELQHSKGLTQLREVKTAAGRLAEQARCAGALRWQAVRLEDEFKEAVIDRLNELAGQANEQSGTVLVFAGGAR